MENVHIKGFFLEGISARTTNQNGQGSKDIGELWQRFTADKILDKIVDRTNDEVYCVYTDYETDYTGYYTAVLGCRVNDLDNIPEGLISLTIPPADYLKLTAKGKLPDCVAETWQKIWNSGIKRKYTADFDLWGAKAHDPQNAEVEIYIAV